MLVCLYSTIKMMHGPINIRSNKHKILFSAFHLLLPLVYILFCLVRSSYKNSLNNFSGNYGSECSYCYLLKWEIVWSWMTTSEFYKSIFRSKLQQSE